MKRIKVTVSYPWPTVTDDVCTVEIDGGNTDSDDEIAFNTALDMIFDRGIDWTWEEIK